MPNGPAMTAWPELATNFPAGLEELIGDRSRPPVTGSSFFEKTYAEGREAGLRALGGPGMLAARATWRRRPQR